MRTNFGERGASLIELLVAIVMVALAVICSLAFYSYGGGGIEKEGNRRAAAEFARSRIEELLAANVDTIRPLDANLRWLSCAGSPCTWTMSTAQVFEQVNVNSILRPMETTVQWVNDPAALGAAGSDTLDLSVRVWYTSRANDDQYNRVLTKTLRTP